MRRAQSQAITFTALDSAGAVVTGLGFSAGEVQVSKDGGARANVAGAVTELGAGLYTVTLTAAETNARWLHFLVRKTGVRPVDVYGGTTGQPAGTVVDDDDNDESGFVTDLVSTTDDAWKYAFVVFTTGALADQRRKVLSYDGATKRLEVTTPFTGAPAAGAIFLLLNI